MISLSSCYLFDLIKPTGGLSVDTEIVVGDKSIATEVSGKKETTNNTADAITQTYNTMNEQAPWWVMLLLVLGWVMPSPSVIWTGIMNLFKRGK